jgi:hypothetical protein
MRELDSSDGTAATTEDGQEEPEAPVGELMWIGGGPVGKSSAGLRIWGDDLDPDEITRLLGCEPTRTRRKGEDVRGKRSTRTAWTGSWHLKSDLPRSAELAAHISALLDRTTDDLATWAALASRYRMDVFCGLFLTAWNQGLKLPPDLLRRLGKRGIPLGIDVYACLDEEGDHPDTPP